MAIFSATVSLANQASRTHHANHSRKRERSRLPSAAGRKWTSPARHRVAARDCRLARRISATPRTAEPQPGRPTTDRTGEGRHLAVVEPETRKPALPGGLSKYRDGPKG